MPKTPLERRLPTISLGEALHKRESHPDQAAQTTLSLDAVSLLVTPLSEKVGAQNRHYPSGGALYPVETYLIGSFESGSKKNTVYHYHPKAHALEKLWDTPETFEFDQLFRSLVDGTRLQAAMIFTAVWERSAKKYGDFAYNLALLEAGHMAQNVLLAATELGVQMCPMGGFDDATASELLDLKNDAEQAVYCLSIQK